MVSASSAGQSCGGSPPTAGPVRRVRYVVVDLAEVTACPAQLVGELAAACRALHAREGWLRSIASSPCVATALESATVDELFPIYRAARTEFRKVS
jgi:anti-anti-sigma regulatory factor